MSEPLYCPFPGCKAKHPYISKQFAEISHEGKDHVVRVRWVRDIEEAKAKWRRFVALSNPTHGGK